MKAKRSFNWRALIIGATVLTLVAAFMIWKAMNKPKVIPPEKIAHVERTNITRSVVAIGHIEALSKVQVKSKANGIIQALLVDVGDPVKEGQVLAELDKDNLQAQVREARATLDGEEANLLMAVAAEAKARIEAANPELDFARRELKRSEKLFGQGISSEQALDDAKKAQEIAANRREYLEAVARSAAAQIVQAKARVAAAHAGLDRAEEGLRNATIRSPITGVVLTRDTEVGDAVSSILNLGSAATLIMTLGDMSSVYVRGEVDEADVGKIHADMPARIKVESFSNERFQGTVTRIAPMGKEKDNVRTFEIRASIANPEGKLRVNMSANAEIVLEEHTNVFVIPESAIVYDGGSKASVQKRDPSAKPGYCLTAVRTGISNGQRTEVLEGVLDGMELVLP